LRTYPVFVPSDRGPLATVLSAPDGPPRGVVLELPGGGTAARIGSALAASMAPRLAEQGLVSIRFDYAGLGDSPGYTPYVSLNDLDSGIDQARRVIDVAASTFGVDRFGIVGTCYGSRIALSLLGDDRCVGVVCLASPMAHYGGRSELRSKLKRGRLHSLVRSSRRLRSLARRASGVVLTEGNKTSPLIRGALDHLDHARLLFLASRFPGDHFSESAIAELRSAGDALPPERRERFSIRDIPHGPLTTFGVLPPASQAAVLDEIVGWIAGSFDARANG
jgi:hypothetical protein